MSAIAIGKKLKEVGLRTPDGQPTPKALEEGFCQSTRLKDGTPFYMWHKHKVAELLKDKGLQKLSVTEVKARKLAEEYIRADKQFQEAIYGIEEEAALEWAKDLEKEARKVNPSRKQ